MKLKFIFRCVLLAILLVMTRGVSLGQAGIFEKFLLKKAPSLRTGLPWLNTNENISLANLKGRFVLLNFWTYGIIDCQEQNFELKKLQGKYPEVLFVIGIHSGKFPAEKETENVRQAVIMQDIDFPVVNDREMRVWRDFGISTWPSIVLIDPQGNMIYRQSGKENFPALDKVLDSYLSKYSDKLEQKPLSLKLEGDKEPVILLNYPGKILADEKGERLFISDSGHNRIIIADFSGQIMDLIGTGHPGLADGAFEVAQFKNPQGLVRDGDILSLADQGNNCIRQVDLKHRQVLTLKDLSAKNMLESPADLALDESVLYIASAGNHQIWAFDLKENTLRCFAGNGQENLVDGPLLKSSLAQSSGLAINADFLFIADSESSAVRQVHLTGTGALRTLIGKGLFAFGDHDGDFSAAQLQHPLDLTSFDQNLVVADTYNNKIKVLDLESGLCRTIAGSGLSGRKDGPFAQAEFFQPAGISYATGKIYVADTNNHAIRVLDLGANRVSTLELYSPGEPRIFRFDFENFSGEKVRIKRQSRNILRIKLELVLPLMGNLFPPADSRLKVFTKSGKFYKSFKIKDLNNEYVINQTIDEGQLFAEMKLYYCLNDRGNVCLSKNVLFEIPLLDSPASGDIKIRHRIEVKAFP